MKKTISILVLYKSGFIFDRIETKLMSPGNF
jgi:hypothetical protein